MKSEKFMGLSLIFVIIGSTLLLTYFRWIQSGLHFGILIAAVVLIAVSALFSFEAIRRDPSKIFFFLLVITIMMFSLSIIRSVRFEVFSGLGSPDNLGEYFVAKATLSRGHWGGDYGLPLDRRPTPYFLSLSVTILPVIFSQITGMNLFTIFVLIYPIIFSLIPTIVFLLVKEVFGKTELAALSTILYIELFQFTSPQHGRQYIALLLLALTLFVAFKSVSTSKKRNYLILFLMFEFGVVTSHYTVSYIATPMFLSIIVASSLMSNSSDKTSRNFFNKYTFVYWFILVISWLSFNHLQFFVENISTAESSILAMLGLTQPKWLSATRIPGRTSDPLTLIWYLFQTVAMIVGLFVIYLKEKRNAKKIAWIISGFILFGILFISAVTPIFSTVLGFNRVYSIASIIFVSFLAYGLLRTRKRLGGVFFIVFLVLNLSINMSLTSHLNYVLYSPENSVPPELAISQTYSRAHEFTMFEWIQEYLPSSQRISVDLRGAINMFFVLNHTPVDVTYPDFAYDSKYLALHFYTLKYGLWWSSEQGISKVNNLDELVINSSVVYNNGESMFLLSK